MLATHTLRITNPRLKQSPICGSIKQYVSPLVLSSKTIKVQKMFWNEDLGYELNQSEEQWLSDANKYFSKTGILPKNIVNLPPVEDKNINLIHLYFGGEHLIRPHCVSVSPMVSSGVLNEIMVREKNLSSSWLKTNRIENREYNLANCGRLAVEKNGDLKVFTFPNTNKITLESNEEYSVQDDEYIVLTYTLVDQFVGTGLISCGLPSLVNFGGFVNNTLQRYTHKDGDIRFALGFSSITQRESILEDQRSSGLNEYYSINKFKNHNQQSFGGWMNQNNYDYNPTDQVDLLDRNEKKADIKGYLVIKPNSLAQKESILSTLNGSFKISGRVPEFKEIYVGKKIPKAFWLSQMNDEVGDIINSGKDALDASFEFNANGVRSLPIVSGFGLLSEPRMYGLDGFKFNHAWAESLSVNTELEIGYFDEKYLFERKYNSSVILWCQKGLDINP